MKATKHVSHIRSSNAALTGGSRPTTEAITALTPSIGEPEGRPSGRAQQHWLGAESEIRARSTRQP